MNKKLLILGLIVFIALFAMSYVSASADIQTDIEFEDLETGSIDQYKDIKLSDNEEKVLKDGKTITKKVNIVKEVKSHGKTKTKKLVSREGFKKSVMKKQIKKAVKGKSVFYDLNKQLKNAKISKITIKSFKFKDHGHKLISTKVTIKYKPVKMVKVYKSTITSIKLDKYGDVEFNYVNPFNGKKEREYGDILYY